MKRKYDSKKTHDNNQRKIESLRSSTITKEIEEINLSDYITIIQNNIEYSPSFNSTLLEKKISLYKEKLLFHFYSKTSYITKPLSKYKELHFTNEKYLTILIYIFLFLNETENKKLRNNKSIFFDYYISLITKIFSKNKLNKQELLIIIKFIVFSSIIERKERRDISPLDNSQPNMPQSLKNKPIQNYSRFKFSIEIIKKINIASLTIDYIDFLKADILNCKTNSFLVTERKDILELMNLEDKNDKIISFLGELFSFKYNKFFLDIFINKIKEIYDNKNINSIEILNFLDRDLLLLTEMQRFEDKKYKEDPFFLSQGFVCNNHKNNGITVSDLIIRSPFTLFFSFCFSPEANSNNNTNNNTNNNNTNNNNNTDDNNNNCNINDLKRINTKEGKKKPKERRYPIIAFFEKDNPLSKDGFSFYIANNSLYYKKYKKEEEIEICKINENQTYFCIYSMTDREPFVIHIKAASDINGYGLLAKPPNTESISKKLNMNIARLYRQNFEGYIGPVILFNNFFDDNFRKYFFWLRGSYHKLVYFNGYNNQFVDKYDKNMNYISNENNEDPKSNYINAMNVLKEKNDIYENILLYIIPPFEGSNLNQNIFKLDPFKEFRANFIDKPQVQLGATFFFENKYTPFEFLRYEGMNFLILILELIASNIDNIENENHRIMVLSIFTNLISFSMDLLYQLNVDYYIDEIRHLLFAVEKCVNKICRKLKMVGELNKTLDDWVISLNTPKKNLSKTYIDCFNKIRNEIINFLFSPDLYDLTNHSCIEYFFNSLNTCLHKNPNGLLNMNILQKIISFSIIFDQITNPQNCKIKSNSQFQSFKIVYRKLFLTFFSYCQTMAPYIKIYQMFSDDIHMNYRKYHFIKFFYLLSEYYFENVDKKGYLNTWKYFVDLFEHLQEKKNFSAISEKEAQKIMAICLRIIIENRIVKDIFKGVSQRKKKVVEQYKIKLNLSKSTITIGNEKPNPSSEKKIIHKRRLSPLQRNFTINNKKKEEKNIVTNLNFESIDTKHINKKRSNSSVKKLIQNEKYKKKFNFESENNTKQNKENNNQIDQILEEEQKQIDWSKYIQYCSFSTILSMLESYKFNDYCFRALLLLILETNNEVIISQETKLKFIFKVKKYDDLKRKEYSEFLKLSYFNRETKFQLKSLITLIKKNLKTITHITYDIFVYLIIKVGEERLNCKCIFNHLIKSKEICGQIFSLALNYNKEAYDLIMSNFSSLINLIVPYHKRPFITNFLYESMTSNNKMQIEYSQVLINIMLATNLDIIDLKFNYYIKVNSLILLYRIVKTKNLLGEDFNFSENGLTSLFDDDFATSKFNIFKNVSLINKKKCYIEVLYEVLISLYVNTKKERYFSIMFQIFISYIQHFKKVVSESQSIIYYIDEIKGIGEKNNKLVKIFPKSEPIEIPCLSLQFLNRTLKYIYKCKDDKIINFLSSMATSFYTDSYLMFMKHSSKKKKTKSSIMYNFLFELLKQHTSNKKQINIEDVIKLFSKQYEEHLSQKQQKLNTTITASSLSSIKKIKALDSRKTSFDIPDSNNLSLNDSFSSCKSSKSIKNKCTNNQKRKCKQMTKRTVNLLSLVIDNIEKGEDPLDIAEEDNNMCNSLSQSDISTSDQLFTTQNNLNSINNSSGNKKEQQNKNLFTINSEENPFSLERIESHEKVILFPKASLIEQNFSIYFLDRLFYNPAFIKMKNYYQYYANTYENIAKKISIENFFDYPIIMKNYISKNLYFGGLFLKHDLNFFTNKYFHISHPYFKDKVSQCIRKRFFPKISDQDDIIKFVIDENDPNNKIFYVDLVTNRNVVFGKLIVSKYLIYFCNLNREQFFNSKDDNEKIKWLLHSEECDYSNRNKKIYIFKKEITEILNRRFLYIFQACEIYLKNGKSYFFNFYSEKKKNDFFSLFDEKKDEIKIFLDLKAEFKKKNFTKQWLENKISTLAYLLFINKYSCRSYNDVNQYPVFPWLIIFGDKERDLSHTIVAQTDDQRMMLREKYPFSDEKNPYHYTTHYSNASFLIYYLIRINPFTDNQITLQVNRFDAPDRQFNSIDELQRVLHNTNQPRELLPEFFISTDFFYNYNCNFYGIRNNNKLVDELENKKSFNTPLEYIINNAILLESTKFKSQINFFFDNIFGIGQMGGVDQCNTYNKYTYQEKVDLKKKIAKFEKDGLTYDEIKMKILKKSSKIISFGQTPYKLFDKKHQLWNPETIIVDDLSKINENTISFPKGIIIYFNFAELIAGKQTLFLLVQIDNFYSEIKFYEKNLKEDKDKKYIPIQKRIKRYSKYYLYGKKQSPFQYILKYNPRFIMIEFNLTLFILCRFVDKSFIIFNKLGDSMSYITESVVTSIVKGAEHKFLTGHMNGKIIEWEICGNIHNFINLTEINVNFVRGFIAHKEKVSSIYYSDLLGLIISSGDDRKIFIRKYYDLSLLTLINLDYNILCIDIKISHNFLYILFFNETIKKHNVVIYSVNGTILSKSDYDLINNIDFDKGGNVLIGLVESNRVVVYNPTLTQKIEEIDLKNVTLKATKKKNQKEFKAGENTLFLNFIYQKETSFIYCLYSGGTLLQKYLNVSNKE